MFIHLLAGALIFLWLGEMYDFDVNGLYLFVGGCFGILPDVIGALMTWNLKFYRWTHAHRNDMFHTIYYPIVVFFAFWATLGLECGIVIGLAVLSHILLDVFGVGWGLRLFYPIDRRTYKLFSGGRLVQVWDDRAIFRLTREFHDDDWFFRILFKFNSREVPWWYGILEWGALVSFFALVWVY